MSSEIQKVLKEAEDRGWYLQRKKKHYVYKHPRGGCVTVSKTLSEPRSWKDAKQNFLRQERMYHNN